MNTGNPQFERDFEAFLGGGDSQLEALYRKLPQAEPDAWLDAAVQAMARRAVAATPAATRTPTRSHWLPMLSAVAVVALAAGVAFRIGPQLWQRPASQSEAAPMATPSLPPPAAPQPTEPVQSAQKAAPAAVEIAAPAAQAPVAELKKVVNAASRPAPRPFPAPVRATQEAAPPPAAAKPLSPAPAMAAPLRAKQVETESAGAPAALAAPAAQDRNASLYPEHWLANIRQMLRDGQREEALRSLAEFRKRYPDYRLPDDLRDLR